jgi:hypothetical protein
VGRSPSSQGAAAEEELLGYVGHYLCSNTLICDHDYMYELFVYYVTLLFFG